MGGDGEDPLPRPPCRCRRRKRTAGRRCHRASPTSTRCAIGSASRLPALLDDRVRMIVNDVLARDGQAVGRRRRSRLLPTGQRRMIRVQARTVRPRRRARRAGRARPGGRRHRQRSSALVRGDAQGAGGRTARAPALWPVHASTRRGHRRRRTRPFRLARPDHHPPLRLARAGRADRVRRRRRRAPPRRVRRGRLSDGPPQDRSPVLEARAWPAPDRAGSNRRPTITPSAHAGIKRCPTPPRPVILAPALCNRRVPRCFLSRRNPTKWSLTR